MRVRDSGFGFLGSGGGDRERSDAFRKGRRPGQKVLGTLIKRVSKDTAWVNIDGHKLLAQIQTNAHEGARLSFVIKQLAPDIILKAVFQPSHTGVSGLTLASNFDTARTLFENRLRPYVERLLKTEALQRKLAFSRLLREDNPLLLAYLDANCSLNAIGNTTGNDAGQLTYAPWLIPSGRRHICLTKGKENLTESIMEFDLPNIGMVRAQFFFRGERISYKLFLQHKSKATQLYRYMTSRESSFLSGDLQCLAIDRLPKRQRSGIIAELIFGS